MIKENIERRRGVWDKEKNRANGTEGDKRMTEGGGGGGGGGGGIY